MKDKLKLAQEKLKVTEYELQKAQFERMHALEKLELKNSQISIDYYVFGLIGAMYNCFVYVKESVTGEN